LEFDYYDSEIVAAAAQKERQPETCAESAFDNHGWRSFPLTFRSTLHTSAQLYSGKVQQLLAQKCIIEEIAALGKDCIIVGRNADVILRAYHPFNIFVCAQQQAKLRRCAERAPEGEIITERELERKMRHIDKSRAKAREIISGAPWGERSAYHLTVNTTGWEIRDLAPVVAAYAAAWFGGQA